MFERFNHNGMAVTIPFTETDNVTRATLKSSRAFLIREIKRYSETTGVDPEEVADTHRLIAHFDAIIEYYRIKE